MLGENSCVADAEISGQIDQFHGPRQTRRNFHRLSVGQSEERTIYIVKILDVFGRFDKFQLSQSKQVAMDVSDGFARVFICRHEFDSDLRML
jgi:hypothetical protein